VDPMGPAETGEVPWKGVDPATQWVGGEAPCILPPMGQYLGAVDPLLPIGMKDRCHGSYYPIRRGIGRCRGSHGPVERYCRSYYLVACQIGSMNPTNKLVGKLVSWIQLPNGTGYRCHGSHGYELCWDVL
jgi:hypothetical protein